MCVLPALEDDAFDSDPRKRRKRNRRCRRYSWHFHRLHFRPRRHLPHHLLHRGSRSPSYLTRAKAGLGTSPKLEADPYESQS